jgi:hypothetical protein
MNAPRKGDRVRVTYEAAWDQDRGTHYWLRDLTDGTTASVPNTATVEVIEPVDPFPVGTFVIGERSQKPGQWDAGYVIEGMHTRPNEVCISYSHSGEGGNYLKRETVRVAVGLER